MASLFRSLQNAPTDDQLRLTRVGAVLHDLDAAKAAIDAEIAHEQKAQAAVRVCVGVLNAHAEARAAAHAMAEATGEADALTETDRARLQVLAYLLKGPYRSAAWPLIHAAFPHLGEKRDA